MERKKRSATEYVPLGVRATAAWSWRLLVIAAALAVLVFLVVQVRIVVVPLVVAILLAALLDPLVNWLQRHRWPRGLGVALAVVGTVVVVAGLLTLISWQISRGVPDLVARGKSTLADLRHILYSLPFGITAQNLNGYLSDLTKSVQTDSNALLTGVLSVGSTAGHVLTGMLLALFSLIFLLYDGRGIARWIIGIFPRSAAPALGGSARLGWHTLRSYVRAQIIVAGIDGIGIGLGALLLGLPMALPLGLLVFLCSFVPFVGAIVSGAIVCIVALIVKDVFWALVMLGIVILVQQVESHVLQPFIMGGAVKVHPLGVVVSVAVGALVAGIPGALFAVPVVAVANTMIGYLVRRQWADELSAAGAAADAGKAAGD
jgi:predicted PurR-regulated permease PerM